MKQTFFSWFSVPTTIVAPLFDSSGEYCLQLFDDDVDVDDDDVDEDDDDDDILEFSFWRNSRFLRYFWNFLEFFSLNCIQ